MGCAFAHDPQKYDGGTTLWRDAARHRRYDRIALLETTLRACFLLTLVGRREVGDPGPWQPS
jgi:hypothetical protein